MTSTSKAATARDIAVSTGTTVAKAAKIFGTGSAGVGLQLATRGYALARAKAERRRARRKAAEASRGTAALPATRSRRLLVIGGVVGVASVAAVVLAKRRQSPIPPADAPPSLADYADSTPLGTSSADAPHVDTPRPVVASPEEVQAADDSST